MPMTPNPMRVQSVAERLQAYFVDELLVSVRVVPRSGLYIVVTTSENPDGGLSFHVDELDNGASGFRETALARIHAYREGRAYTPPPAGPLSFDDVMTYSGARHE